MLTSTAFFAALFALGVGIAVFWANPKRRVNRVVCTGSLNVAAWLGCFHMTATSAVNGQFWLEWTCSVGALAPMHLWIVKEAIANDLRGIDWRKVWGWAVVSTLLAVLPFTDWFIPPESTADRRLFGWGYHAYVVLDLLLYAYLLYDSAKSIRELTGAKRLELQFWLVGGCGVAAAIVARMALRAFSMAPVMANLQPIAIMGFYTGAAYLITSHRMFDARQLLRVGIEKLILVVSVAGAAFVLNSVFGLLVSGPLALVGTTILALWIAADLNDRLNRVFQFYPEAAMARQAAFDAARRETKTEQLESAFQSVLKGWGHTDHALLISGSRDLLRSGGIEITGENVVLRSMRQLRWATPERIARERPTAAREAVGRFLKEHGLGVLVIGEGPVLTALVGVGVAASRRPFTYPQVTQLMELTSIMESALERAHFSMKVQHAEQLATVGLLGASLAHEIRNPLVTIKTFVQLLPTHHHDAAFRSKFFKLIGDEVNRIDRLTEQLLDLASPRAYAADLVELHPVLRASLDLVAAKANDKHIEFITDFQAAPDVAWTDASAAKQVMLNLCFNAIQALESREGERWVQISTRNTADGIEMAVADSGPGIAEEIRPRLFQPFQTTKSSGFGLGLAICSDILANLNATITVDPSAPGRGATFRVIFPCQPS